MSERLLTYLYQYGVGGLVFLGSLVLLWRTGMLGSDRRTRRIWVALLVLGVVLYAVAQGALQFLGPRYDLDLGGGP
jgi:drug/metabolite transporter (DMT)-like permease